MNGANERKDSIKKERQELEAKILLRKLKKEQEALKTLEAPYSRPGYTSSWWGSTIWMLLFILMGGSIIVFSSDNLRDNLTIAMGTGVMVSGVFGISRFFLQRRLDAVKHLILEMKNEISNLKSTSKSN